MGFYIKMLCQIITLQIFFTVISAELGPFQGLRTRDTPHPQDPSCVWFTSQDDLAPETVQVIAYGAPEASIYLAMGLMGDGVTFPQANQKVTVHYALFLDNCDFIESSREVNSPFSFMFGAGEVITGFERGIKEMTLGQRASITMSSDMGYGEAGAGGGTIHGNATLIFDVEILAIEDI